MRQICVDTQAAHSAGGWDAPAHSEDDTVVIVTPHGRAEVQPDSDGYYPTGAFHWPWTEHTDRDVDPTNKLVQTIRWKCEPTADSWTVIAAGHGWRAKVIDVLATPSPEKAPARRRRPLQRPLRGRPVLLRGHDQQPGRRGAAAAVRAHFAATRADRDPDATVVVFDLTEVQLPGPRP